jgi:hypothetical protein
MVGHYPRVAGGCAGSVKPARTKAFASHSSDVSEIDLELRAALTELAQG